MLSLAPNYVEAAPYRRPPPRVSLLNGVKTASYRHLLLSEAETCPLLRTQLTSTGSPTVLRPDVSTESPTGLFPDVAATPDMEPGHSISAKDEPAGELYQSPFHLCGAQRHARERGFGLSHPFTRKWWIDGVDCGAVSGKDREEQAPASRLHEADCLRDFDFIAYLLRANGIHGNGFAICPEQETQHGKEWGGTSTTST